MFDKAIELQRGDQSLHFTVDVLAYETYIKDLFKGKPTVAAKDLCRRCVTDADKPLLEELIKKGAAISIAGTLVENFSEEHEFVVKK